MKEKLIKLLDEYYGDCRGMSHKEEIVDFIENNSDRITKIIEDDNTFIDLSNHN